MTTNEEFLKTADIDQKAAFVEQMLELQLGELLLEGISANDINQTELAARMGRGKSEVSKILKGRNVRLSTVARCFAALDLKLDLASSPIASKSKPFVFADTSWIDLSELSHQFAADFSADYEAPQISQATTEEDGEEARYNLAA